MTSQTGTVPPWQQLTRPQPIVSDIPAETLELKKAGDRDRWASYGGPGPAGGLWGLLGLVTGLGILIDGIAVAVAPSNYGLGLWLFWPAVAGPNAVYAYALLSSRASGALRAAAVTLLGLYGTVLFHMSNPLVFGGFDEHLHERTLSDLLLGGGLFAPNPELAVSPNYPGLEIFTGALTRLSGVPLMVGAFVALLVFRLILIHAIYQGALTLNRSPRFGSLVVLIYATSPQFYFFNDQFAYQSMALPLGLAGLLLLRRAQLAGGRQARRLTALAVIVLGITVVTHHVTSWAVLAFLIGWTVTARRQNRSYLVFGCVFMAAAVALWTATVYTKMTAYLGPVMAQAGQQLNQMLGGAGGQRQAFSNPGGMVTPEWQRALLIAYALAYTICAITCGIILLRRAFRQRRTGIGMLGLISIVYPVTIAAHFLPSTGSMGDRASTFMFLPLAVAIAVVLAGDGRMPTPGRAGRLVRGRGRIVFAALIGIAYVGGILLGAGPDWYFLPGKYLVVADERSQDPYTLAAVKWAASDLKPGTRVLADRVSADLLSGEARLWPLLNPENGVDISDVYFSPTWSSYQTNELRKLHVADIYVDQRYSQSLPQEGYYIFEGETSPERRLTTGDLSKFAHVRGLKAVYHQGPITIYSTAGLGVVPQQSGFTGQRSLGFGAIGDSVLGAFVVLAAYLGRRRLKRVLAATAGAGAVGLLAAGVSLVTLAGFALFGLGIMPGPWFTVGGGVMAVAAWTTDRLRNRRPRRAGRERSRESSHWRVDLPLVIAGLWLVVVGATICLHAAWVLDVLDVRLILSAGH